MKVYDTVSQQRITFIDRPAGSPRADLFKCSLFWQDDQTLLIGWADHIKVARISQVPIRNGMSVATAGLTTSSQYVVEVTAIFQVDCMISGICPYEKQDGYLILAYVSPDQYDNEATDDPAEQRRKAANRPELRIISKQGEEMSLDALSLTNYHLYGCNDYVLVPSRRPSEELYLVVSPKDVVCARPRDESDHVAWLVDRKRFAEALERAEALAGRHGHGLDVRAIGVKYITHLFEQGASLGFEMETGADWSRGVRRCGRAVSKGARQGRQGMGRLGVCVCTETAVAGESVWHELGDPLTSRAGHHPPSSDQIATTRSADLRHGAGPLFSKRPISRFDALVTTRG